MLWGAVSSDRNRICRCVSKGSSASLCRVSDYSGEKVTISDLSIETFMSLLVVPLIRQKRGSQCVSFYQREVTTMVLKSSLTVGRCSRANGTSCCRTVILRRRIRLFGSKKEAKEGGSYLTSLIQQSVSSLESFAHTDFDRAKLTAERLQRAESRIAARLSLAQAALQ